MPPFSGQDPHETLHDGKQAPGPREIRGASFTIGADAGTTIAVTIQLLDGGGKEITWRGCIMAYLSDDANGDSVTGTGPSTETAIGTDGVLIPIVAKKAYWLTSESDGDIDLVVTEAAGATWYLVLVMPNGRLIVSDAITFAA